MVRRAAPRPRCRPAPGTGVAALHGAGRVEAVELTDGSRVAADLVVVGMGALPNTEWLADSGLQLNPGLECDATLTAVGDPDILGAGDIVSWPHPLADGDAIRIEHWTVAAEQGQLAGRNVLLAADERKPYDQPPYFWSDQYDTKIQSLGLPGRAERLELLESTEDGSRFVYGGRARRTAGRRDRDQRGEAARLLPDGAGGPAGLRRRCAPTSRPMQRHSGPPREWHERCCGAPRAVEVKALLFQVADLLTLFRSVCTFRIEFNSAPEERVPHAK